MTPAIIDKAIINLLDFFVFSSVIGVAIPSLLSLIGSIILVVSSTSFSGYG